MKKRQEMRLMPLCVRSEEEGAWLRWHTQARRAYVVHNAY